MNSCSLLSVFYFLSLYLVLIIAVFATNPFCKFAIVTYYITLTDLLTSTYAVHRREACGWLAGRSSVVRALAAKAGDLASIPSDYCPFPPWVWSAWIIRSISFHIYWPGIKTSEPWKAHINLLRGRKEGACGWLGSRSSVVRAQRPGFDSQRLQPFSSRNVISLDLST